MLSVNPQVNPRKRSIIEANYNGNKTEEEEEDNNNSSGRVVGKDVLIHSVSYCEFDADNNNNNNGSGLRQRRKKTKYQRHDTSHDADDEGGHDELITEVSAAAAATSAAASQSKKEEQQQQQQRSTSPPSVVPLSMQLFRPFWMMSYCPDPNCNINHNGMGDGGGVGGGNHNFLMESGSGSSSLLPPPPSIDGGLGLGVGVGGRGGGENSAASSSTAPKSIMLDTRMRSVSMDAFKGVSSSSASSTITGGVSSTAGRMKLSSSSRDSFKAEDHEEEDDDEEEDINEDLAAAVRNNNTAFLPSSSSSLESSNNNKHSPSSSLLNAVTPSNRMSSSSSWPTLHNHVTPAAAATTITSSSSSSALAQTITIEQLLHEYTTACTIFGCSNRINPGVLTTLRYQLPTLRVSGNFFDADMLALSEILLRHCNGALKYITRLDFSIAAKEGKASSFGGGSGNGKKGFRSHGAYALAKVLGMSEYIEEVYLMGNHVGPFGAQAIFSSVGRNERTVLKCLLMRGCRIGERGALSFVRDVLKGNSSTEDDDEGNATTRKEIVLEEVDFSANRIGFKGCYEIERALKVSATTLNATAPSSSNAITTTSTNAATDTTTTTVWTPSGVKISASAHSLHVDLEANLVFQEVMNCITHGLGIILAIIGSILLSAEVQGKPSNYVNSCAIYSASLIVLFSCSTLYHSFFALTRVRFIFRVFDRCAIYLLIGGSYSPLLNIALQKHDYTKLLWFIWTYGCCGMVTEATLWNWKHKSKFSLAMYFGIAWSCIVCVPDLIESLPPQAMWLLAAGAVAYTSGVPFFVRNTNLDHSIWHVFVLAGATLHWLSVYLYVAKLPVG